MAGGRKITIEFLGKPDKAIAAASKVEQRFGKMGGKLERIGGQAGKVLAGGLLLGGAALVKLGRGAAEDETAAKNLANTLRNTAGATRGQVAQTENWITAQGKALGVADDELRPALAKLATVTHSVGDAQNLTSLAMDISAGSGKSLSTVTAALAKAQLGHTAGLEKLGVTTKDAAGKTLSLDQITANLAKTYKGAASSAANTTEGKQKRLQVTLSEMGETIGYKVLPFMLKMVNVGSKMADWAGKHTKLVGGLAAGLGALVVVVWAVGAAMKAWIAVTQLWSGITKVAAAVQWAFNAAMDANPIGLVILAIAALAVGLVILWKKSETFRKIVMGAFHGVQHAAAAVWNWIKATWPKLGAIVAAPFQWAWKVIKGAWDKIRSGASNAVNWVKDKFHDLVGFVKGLPGKIGNAAKGMFNGIKGAFRSAINWIISKWNNLSFGIPAIKIAGKTIFPGARLNTPNIPMLEHGGTLTSAGDVIVGDHNGRGGERLSLPKGARVTPLSKSDGDVANLTINVMAPDGKVLQTQLLKLKRQNGGLLLGLA